MSSKPTPESIVADLYRAGAGFHSWQVPLAGIAEHTNSISSTISGASLRFRPARSVFLYQDGRLSPEAVQRYSDFMDEQGCLRWEYARAQYPSGPLGFMNDFDYIDEGDMNRHPYYQEILAYAGLRYAGIQNLRQRDDVAASISIQRSRSQGPPEIRHARFLRMIGYHLEQAMDLEAHLAERREVAGTADPGTVPLGSGVSLSTRDGTLLSLGSDLEPLLRAGVFRLRSNVLTASTARLAHEVEDALRAATRGAIARITLANRGSRMTFAPVIPDSGLSLHIDLVALSVEPLADVPAREDPVQHFSDTHGLTASECDVLRRLARGQSPARIAAARSTSLGTVRTQLRSIYRKTGEHSQRALLARLSR